MSFQRTFTSVRLIEQLQRDMPGVYGLVVDAALRVGLPPAAVQRVTVVDHAPVSAVWATPIGEVELPLQQPQVLGKLWMVAEAVHRIGLDRIEEELGDCGDPKCEGTCRWVEALADAMAALRA